MSVPTLLRAAAVATGAAVLALIVPVAVVPSAAAAPSAPPPATASEHASEHAASSVGRTSAREAARVDRVPTPMLRWTACQGGLRCATVRLPLDYDDPKGPTVSVALLKVPATDPARRMGSLFLNPGGPGGSGKDVAIRAVGFLSPSVRARFDLVGMDPRGTNDSTRVTCYPDAAAQADALDGYAPGFPLGRQEETAHLRAAGRLARACGTTGRPLSASMSTAEVARDLDVVRRAVGDRRLTFLGWSYGTYLAQAYAGLFPDRVRALALDGVVDAVAWTGTPATRVLPSTVRMGTALGTSEALRTSLRRCRAAGAPRCPLMPDPEAAFASVASRLRDEPLQATDPDGTTYTITYADFVEQVLYALYAPEAVEDVPLVVQAVQELLDPRAPTAARSSAAGRWNRLRSAAGERRGDHGARAATAAAEPLANDLELAAAVLCSDSLNPHGDEGWLRVADQVDRVAPYFGRHWLWASAPCARWTATDEDAWTGPYDVRPAAPLLVVGGLHDPATPYLAAAAVAARVPGSRLLTSDSWGHTAYGTSACVTRAVDRYLLGGVLPARDTVCRGDVQPYAPR